MVAAQIIPANLLWRAVLMKVLRIQAMLQKAFSRVAQIGIDPQDSDEIRLQKTLMVVIALMVIPAAVLWGIAYLFFGEKLAASIPLSYAVMSSLSIFIFGRTKFIVLASCS
jgi:hypothetical protein